MGNKPSPTWTMTGFARHTQLEFLVGRTIVLVPRGMASQAALAFRHVETQNSTHLFSEVILQHSIGPRMPIFIVPGMKFGQINEVDKAKFLVGGIELTGPGLSIVTENARSDAEILRLCLRRGGNSAIAGLLRVCLRRSEDYQCDQQAELDDRVEPHGQARGAES